MADSINKTNRLISTLNRIQFVAEFFLFSKVSENSDLIPQFLTIIEGMKFYLKSVAVSQSKGIYLENANQSQVMISPISKLQVSRSTIDEEIQRSRSLLDLIKKKPYQAVDYYAQITEKMGCDKQMQLITSVEVPQQLRSKKINVKNVLGEILTVLRPLISIICIRLFGINSYKSYLASLLLDLAIIFYFQKDLKVRSIEQKQQIAIRRRSLIKRYIFRKPFYELVKRLLIVPVMGKIIKPERTISSLLISVFDMQSSISLTL